MEEGQDRSIIEIKNLNRKLNPKQGSHKDRVRALTRFRNFASGLNNGKKGKATTPAFYDDDLPLLFLGSESPTALYDEQYGDLSSFYGLLQACATPSGDHSGGLKRSARNAMNLVKYLALEHVELEKGEPVPGSMGIDATTGLPELNPFAYALCTMNPAQLQIAHFELHLKGGDSADASARAGAKGDACQVLVLLFTRHFDPNSNSARNANTNASPPTLLVGDLLPTAASRQAFENWMVQNVSKEVQNLIKARATKESPTSLVQTPSADESNPFVGVGDDEVEVEADILASFKKRNLTESERLAVQEAEAHAEGQLDQLGLNLYKKDDLMSIGGGGGNEPATCWKDSKMAKKQIQLNSAESATMRGGGTTDELKPRDEEKIKLQNEERQKMIGKDPLSIRPATFDLKNIQAQALAMLTDAVRDLAEAMEDMEPEEVAAELARKKKKKKDKYAYSVEQLVSLGSQKGTLEGILNGGNNDKTPKNEGEEEKKDLPAKDLSILSTDANFNPMLFLTLVHRNASYEQLKKSIQRLDNQTDDNMQRIQQRVRDNFELYIRCADGIDLFSDKAGRSKTKQRLGVHEQIDELDNLADNCSVLAKKSFKPLLDNTNEVRKVQSALAVLNRVGPLLQVPALMRQHIENGRFSAAVKAYRRVLVIGDDTKINLLAHVKIKAAEAARDARHDLECRLANPTLPVQSILDSIRDLRELKELDIPEEEEGKSASPKPSTVPRVVMLGAGQIAVGETNIDVRKYPASIACLMLQAAHFSHLVNKAVFETDSSTERLFNGESLASISEGGGDFAGDAQSVHSGPSTAESKASTDKRERNRWKYDVLETRVISTIQAVSIARTWLPRLVGVAEAARQAEKRRAARVNKRDQMDSMADSMKTFEVFISSISPSMRILCEHVAFCALGCFNGETEQELTATYGENAAERLSKLIKSPLTALQTSKCAVELADLADIVSSVVDSALLLRPTESDYYNGFSRSPQFQRTAMESTLDEVALLIQGIVVTAERRKCIYAFDQCARACSQRASGSGILDGNAIISCLQTLSEDLSHPESCAAEIDKGCELVFSKSCEGLGSHVRDRGDSARLRAVSECATALSSTIDDVIREVTYLANSSVGNLEESLVEDVMALEAVMFDDFLESIRRNMSLYCKLGPMLPPNIEEDDFLAEKKQAEAQFPSHLSACLLAIVRCRAQVDRTLGEKTIRRCQTPSTYQFLAMSTAADSVVDGICYEINQRMARMRGFQADQYLNELQFLLNTLKRYLSDQVLHAVENVRGKLLSKTGGGVQGQGPDGLGAIERLERLGRIYVLCLGE